MKVLFVGDIVGSPGVKTFKSQFADLKNEYAFDFCIVNAENAAGGFGITAAIAKELYETGADVITTGNHIWSRKEILTNIDSDTQMIRPANFHPDNPGRGSAIVKKNGMSLGVLNLIGRIFMDPADCPFRTADRAVTELRKAVKAVIVDFHAEATSEKCCLAWYLDGRVSAVLGTHTHVQTADERILPFGTAFVSDVGMTGPYDGIIGMDRKAATDKLIKNLNDRLTAAAGRVMLNAVILEIDEATGKTTRIARIFNVTGEYDG